MAGQESPLGLQSADLNLKARYRRDEDNLTLTGPLAWSAQGWRGNLDVRGIFGGENLQASAVGAGVLSVTARLGDAALTGELGRLAPLRPEGWVQLQDWDIAALWGRPDQLRLTGRADLAGADWSSVQARLSGQLDDVTGELSGVLSGEWTAGGGRLHLNGPRVYADASLVDSRYRLDLRFEEEEQVGLARLLPAEWGMEALKASGQLNVRGGPDGLDSLDASGLEVNGVQRDAGPFTLYGRASYRPQENTLQAALAGGYGGGLFRIGGSLPQGLNVQVANVSLDALGSEELALGRLNGEATLTGPLDRADLSGEFWTAGGNVNARVSLLGRLDDPRIQGNVNLSGETKAWCTSAPRTLIWPPAPSAAKCAARCGRAAPWPIWTCKAAGPRWAARPRSRHQACKKPSRCVGRAGSSCWMRAQPAAAP
ncbi:hypothetical protein [Deinococcus radiophilus]|uniref:hypothetical protein n=1 Tax=Deinococcus radiophilus TaxID=32062 RepID=UPI00360DBE70